MRATKQPMHCDFQVVLTVVLCLFFAVIGDGAASSCNPMLCRLWQWKHFRHESQKNPLSRPQT